jgi:hypothetical protein
MHRIRDPAVSVPEAMEFQLMTKLSSSRSRPDQHGSQRKTPQDTSHDPHSRMSGSRSAPGRSPSSADSARQASGHQRASNSQEEE